MKYALLLLVLLPYSLKAQKTYVWCAETVKTIPREEFLVGDTIDVVLFDGRNLDNTKRDKCKEGELTKSIEAAIAKTYPKSNINILTNSQYYKDPSNGRITIKIGISGYHAAFGSDIQTGIGNVGGNFSYGVFPKSAWNAITAYSVKVYDNRPGRDMKKTRDIYKTASGPNTWGYKSAKRILDQTFTEANKDLFFFIDESLMK